VSACRSCFAPIIWRNTEKGRPIPLDPEPTPNGDVRVDEHGTAHVLPNEPRLGTDELHRSHFATCPDADRHRGR